MTDYKTFLQSKRQSDKLAGFEPVWMPDFLFDFQGHLTGWSIRKGRGAILADCGLGKTPMQLVWAENVVRKTNRNVLIAAPLTVAAQTIREGEKFGIEVKRSWRGEVHKGITITNYERLHHFNPNDFVGMVCDESGILKHFDSKTRGMVIDFMQPLSYRLLCTATPAPNDYTELGNSAEAVGQMTRMQMLGMFFSHTGKASQDWELKGHGQSAYWRWVAGWARALRKPSDFGYEDGDFILPPLTMKEHLIPSKYNGQGKGFWYYANTLQEQRAERKRSLKDRCGKVAELMPKDRPCLVWCHLNDEGDLLEKMIPGAVQVAGRHKDEEKEERLMAFVKGQIRVLVTKPKIGGWGMNFQHCADVFCFPSHSWEAFYQTTRRCWRFGQKNPVTCNLVATEAEKPVMKNMLKKDRQAAAMFDGIIREMHDFQVERKEEEFTEKVEVPSWL